MRSEMHHVAVDVQLAVPSALVVEDLALFASLRQRDLVLLRVHQRDLELALVIGLRDARVRGGVGGVGNGGVGAERGVRHDERRRAGVRVWLAGLRRLAVLEALDHGHELHAEVRAVEVFGVDRLGAVLLEPHEAVLLLREPIALDHKSNCVLESLRRVGNKSR